MDDNDFAREVASQLSPVLGRNIVREVDQAIRLKQQAETGKTRNWLPDAVTSAVDLAELARLIVMVVPIVRSMLTNIPKDNGKPGKSGSE
jgi:hypothetical protein